MEVSGKTWEPIEMTFKSKCSYQDPFNEIEMDVIIRDETGTEWKVPCFWAGKDIWKARFSAPHTGEYTYETVCLNETDTGLHGSSGVISVKKYDGRNPLYIHGPIEIMDDHRHFMYHDKTPFPWLGDTWWPLECSRLSENGEVQRMVEDRVKKGFTLVHVVNGFWCDVAPYDRRLANEAGFAWTKDFSTINPEYYNIAGKKIQVIADAGLVIAMAATWGFYIDFMGVEKMKKHVRYMIARYGAYSTIWLTAGETAMPYYDYEDEDPIKRQIKRQEVTDNAIKDWTKVMRYMKSVDPFHRLSTAHVTVDRLSIDDIEDPELLDFLIYQAANHDGNKACIAEHVNRQNARGLSYEPIRPVLNSETCYEGMMYQCGADIQRWLFWHAALDGSAGWSYGANGIFNMNHDNDPFGICHYNINWGEQTWQEAIDFEGAKQVGASRKYLNQYEWWKLLPAQDIVEDTDGTEGYDAAIAAQTDEGLIMVYKQRIHNSMHSPTEIKLRNLIPGVCYQVKAYNPIRDYEISLGTIEVNADGKAVTPKAPVVQDWVIILEK